MHVQTKIKRDNNHGYIDFNKNSSGCYRLYFKGNENPYTISLQKKVIVDAKTTTTFSGDTATYTGVYSDIGRTYPLSVKISVSPDESGNIYISATVKVNGKTINLSATDTVAAPLGNVAPYESGYIGIIQGYCNSATVQSFSVKNM